MALVRVAAASELSADSVLEVLVGDTPYAICNVGGSVTALYGICPHRGGPLGQGAIHGQNVVCPWHAWEWNCTTGVNDMDESKKVAVCELKIEGGDILLNLPG
jgi:nitrite reductase/ring-hydroxylating ferredoxin subunit